jgi:hypothetical protein
LQDNLITLSEEAAVTRTSLVVAHEALDGVVECQLLNTTRTRGDGLLDLVNEHILRLVREYSPLIRVEVRKVGVTLNLKTRHTRRDVGAPEDSEFDIVVLKSDQGQGGLPVFTKEESKRKKGLARANWEHARLALCKILSKDTGGDVGRKVVIVLVNHLTSDEELDPVDNRGPINGLRR